MQFLHDPLFGVIDLLVLIVMFPMYFTLQMMAGLFKHLYLLHFLLYCSELIVNLMCC